MGRSFNAGGQVQAFGGAEQLALFNCPTLAANTDNYAVNSPNFFGASILGISASALINLTGLMGGTPNRELTLVNVGAQTITLKNNVTSAPGSRFQIGGDQALSQWGGIRLIWNAAANAWINAGGGGGGGGGGAPTDATYITATDETGPLPQSVPAKAPSGARLVAGGQNINNNAVTALTWSSAEFDTDGYFSAGNPTRLTVPETGLYIVSASCLWQTGSSGQAALQFQVNGNSHQFGFSAVPLVAGTNIGNSVTCVLSLTAGDYVEATVRQVSGGTLGILASDSLNQFSIAKVGISI